MKRFRIQKRADGRLEVLDVEHQDRPAYVAPAGFTESQLRHVWAAAFAAGAQAAGEVSLAFEE